VGHVLVLARPARGEDHDRDDVLAVRGGVADEAVGERVVERLARVALRADPLERDPDGLDAAARHPRALLLADGLRRVELELAVPVRAEEERRDHAFLRGGARGQEGQAGGGEGDRSADHDHENP
jgi:hypothetical protein